MEARGRNTRVLYIIAIGLLIVLFSVSIWLSVSDPQGTIDEYHKLSFPDWLLIPQASAKLLGLIGEKKQPLSQTIPARLHWRSRRP